ncbi:hypothetical protein C5748_12820 [Phyllobacterium phragmitis]|uniref:Uncharacterized protein n=1 Tax=Phyllobacterium phragmitis TaxID=2670329 RepID=A0A2S9IRC6_9HYPH|nr:hypothetical protein [Phyllobacterium phragmitis]PRD43085.1 hypothetical protein C5748_12820 [Phyllobacterium phragmitis]
MRKFILLTSTLAILGLCLGSTYAQNNSRSNAQSHAGYNASDDFGFSEQNDLPSHGRQQFGRSDVGVITDRDRMHTGYPALEQPGDTKRVYRGWIYRGYNASDDFGPS